MTKGIIFPLLVLVSSLHPL